MGTATVRRGTPPARRIEAEWRQAEDRAVVLSVSHSQHSRSLVATVRRERIEFSHGMESRIYAPFQDIARVAAQRIPRYSPKALEAFFAEAMATVEAERDGDGEIGAIFREGTTA